MRILVPVALLSTLFGCGRAVDPGPPDGPRERPRQERPGGGGDAQDDKAESEGFHRVELGKDSAGEERVAFYTLPKSYDPKGSKTYPAVWVFHGGKNSTMRSITPNFEAHFDDDVIFVFPNGQRKDRDTGAWFAASGDDHRHVDVLREAYRRIAKEVRLDDDRQYATGFSSGAHMTWQLACEANDIWDGYAGVAHSLKASYQSDCNPPKNQPILVVAGTSDTKAPIDGNVGPDGSPNALGAVATARYFADASGCGPAPAPRPLPRFAGVEAIDFPGCGKGKVEILTHPGGHEWPGSSKRRNADALDLTAHVLEFFDLD